jgi:hypothetical protein
MPDITKIIVEMPAAVPAQVVEVSNTAALAAEAAARAAADAVLQAALDAKAATSHTHAIGDTTGLQAALDAKAAASHTHAIGDTTGLQAALDAKAATSHTHAIGDTTGLQAALNAKAAASHTHAIGDTTGLQAALDAKAAATEIKALLTAEVDLGSAVSGGSFILAGFSGLTPGSPVMIQQAAGPYTGKGTLADEAEMDPLLVTAYCLDATTVTVIWNALAGPVSGNFKFNYFSP